MRTGLDSMVHTSMYMKDSFRVGISIGLLMKENSTFTIMDQLKMESPLPLGGLNKCFPT